MVQKCYSQGILLIVLLLHFAAACFGRIVNVELLYTGDLKGQIWPPRTYRQFSDGGLLRCATLIKQRREDNPKALLLDSGESLRGTPESDVLERSPVLQAFSRLEYDACVPAESDFGRGVASLKNNLDHFTPALLAANLNGLGGRNPMPSLKPFKIFNIDGVNVAVVGLTNPKTPLRIRRELLGGLEWRSSCEALAEIIPDVRAASADMHILLAHQGLADSDDPDNEVRKIIERFPIFDVVIGGNTAGNQSALMVNSTLYTQPGSRGDCLGVVAVDYDTVADRIVSRQSRLIQADKSIPMDEDLKHRLEPRLQEARRLLETTIGKSDSNFQFDPQDSDGDIREIVLQAVKDAVEADIVLLSMQTRQGIWERTQSERDLWRILPYQDRIGVLMLTFEQIEMILEANAENEGKLSFLESLGVKYELEYDEDEAVGITGLRLSDGSRPHPRKRFSVALSSYVLASGNGRFGIVRELASRPRTCLKLVDKTPRDALREYIIENSPISTARVDEDVEEDDD